MPRLRQLLPGWICSDFGAASFFPEGVGGSGASLGSSACVGPAEHREVRTLAEGSAVFAAVVFLRLAFFSGYFSSSACRPMDGSGDFGRAVALGSRGVCAPPPELLWQ